MAAWRTSRLNGKPWHSVDVGAYWLDVIEERPKRFVAALVDPSGRAVARRRCTSLAGAKAAAVRLALEVLDEMRRAVEGLR